MIQLTFFESAHVAFPFVRTGGGRLILRLLKYITFMLKKYETFVLAFNMLCVRIFVEILVGP